MNNACVIGYGTVGKATALAFGIEKHFSRHDANMELNEVSHMKYIFLCLPTPVTPVGTYEVQPIIDIVEQIASFPQIVDSVIINRSTVYPGFAKSLQSRFNIDNVVSNPEFLSEDTWEEDAKKPQMVIIGADNPKYRDDVKALYMGRYKYIEPIMTDTVTAELAKLTLNNFFSLKVMYFNEVFDYAQNEGANYETIRQVVENHPWGARNHTQPYYKGRRGIHGKCLPKDLAAFATMTGSELLKVVQDLNRRFV